MDIYTIIFLGIAIVVLLRLRSVLGRRTGSERPPFDPYSRSTSDAPTGDKVVTLPPRAASRPVEPPAPAPVAVEEIRKIAPDNPVLADGLAAIAAADRSFDPTGFVAGARRAYEMIVTAFAEGDRKQLKQLLSREVYDGFVAAISARESRGEKVEFNFVGIDKAEIVEADMRGSTAHVTLRFASKLVSATRDAAGTVIDGDPVHVSDVNDIWTFAREVSSRDPNWKLVATESVD